jgi:hypothetical protein
MLYRQAFKKLSNGLISLADTAAEFDSKMLTGLLRSAPDLTPNLKHVQSMFRKPSEGMLAILNLPRHWSSYVPLVRQ